MAYLCEVIETMDKKKKRKFLIKTIQEEISRSSTIELEGLAEYWICEGNKYTNEPYMRKKLKKVV